MTTNDNTGGTVPIASVADVGGTAIAPAKQARNAPNANTRVTRGLSDAIAVAISRSRAVALMMRPVFVRSKNQNRPATTAEPTRMTNTLKSGSSSDEFARRNRVDGAETASPVVLVSPLNSSTSRRMSKRAKVSTSWNTWSRLYICRRIHRSTASHGIRG